MAEANNSFCFLDYDAIGFDMDCCIAKYYLDVLFELGYHHVSQYLVRVKGYDPRLGEPAHLHKDLVARGLILDKAKGNLLKIGENGVIFRCSHGSRQMTRAEIDSTYGEVWDGYQELVGKYNHSDTFYLLESLFDTHQGAVFARMVDLCDEKNGGVSQENYTYLWVDMSEAVRDYYTFKNDDDGRVFTAVRKTPEKFVRPCTEEVKTWLRKFRQEGKLVFLMTSSGVPLTKVLLTHILGSDLEEYFEFFLCQAHKPGFFFSDTLFIKEGDTEGKRVNRFDAHCYYSKGNLEELQVSLRTMTDKEKPRVLYVGDGMKNDAFPSKHYAGWDALLIMENMLLEHEHNKQKTNKAETTLEPDKDLMYDGYAVWGSVYGDEMGGKQVQSVMSEMISKYADLAIPLVDVVADKPLDHRFPRFTGAHPRAGYFPFLPSYYNSS